MAGFGDIPERQNGIDQLIEASWFNTIRTKLIAAFGSGAYIKVQDVQTVADDDTLVIDTEAFKPFVPVIGDGALATLNILPFGATPGFQAGKEIIIMGTSDAFPVKIFSNDVANGILFNGVSVTLKKWNKVTLMYYPHEQRIVELSRNF